jgi:N-acetylmuramoyl-L-alanine amidase
MRWNNLLGVLLCSAFVLSSARPAQQPAMSPSPQVSAPASSAGAQRRPQEFFVMIDPSHGGDDTGAVFGNKLLEKDITLKLGRELKKQLEDHGIACRMLRESDVEIALDRRAELTNEQHAGIYIALHAGRPGRGIRVYAPLLPEPQPPVGRFVPWEGAQALALERSKALADAIAGELKKKDFSAATLSVPLRPLNNIAAPAVAVELAPNEDLQSLESSKRYTGVASAIVSAIAPLREHMGAHP